MNEEDMKDFHIDLAMKVLESGYIDNLKKINL